MPLIDGMKTEDIKESVKKFAEKLLLIGKAHYEKVILGAVLLALATTAVWQFLDVRAVRAELSKETAVHGRGGEKAKSIDFTNQNELLRMAKQPVPFDLSKGHYVFNPGLWKQYSNSVSNILIQVKSGKEFGIGALYITNITPLQLRLTVKVSGTEERPNYSIQAVDDWPFPMMPRFQRSLIVGSTPVKIVDQPGVPTNAVSVILHGVKGDFDSQQMTFDLQLRYSGPLGGVTNRVRLLQNQTQNYLRGYTASMVYMPANRSELNLPFLKRRVGTSIEIDGELYTIIDMTENKVIFSHVITGKQTEVPLFGFRDRP